MENNFNQNTPVPEEPTQDTCQDASQETTAQAAPETAPKPPVKVRRVGTFSLGLMLVAIGAIQLAQIFMPNVNVLSVVKYAPVVLIVLGIEVLIYAARPDVKIKYDGVSIFLCIIIMLTAGASGAVGSSPGIHPRKRDQACYHRGTVQEDCSEGTEQYPQCP